MSPWVIYWIGIADNVVGMARCMVALSILFLVVGGFLAIINSNDWEDFIGKLRFARVYLVGLLLLLGCSVGVSTFCPSGKTLAAMYVLPAIVNNEELRQDSKEVYRLAVDFLKGQLEQVKPEEPAAP